MLKSNNKMTFKQVMKLGMSLSVAVDALMYTVCFLFNLILKGECVLKLYYTLTSLVKQVALN